MSIFTHTTTSNSRERHTLLWLLAVVFTAAAIVLAATTAAAHGAPIIDGLYTGDWCAPAIVGVYGADTLGVLTPALCPLGSEIFWDDWDATNYGGPPPGVSDTMGWLFFGGPGTPVTDWEVDIDLFATTADPVMVFFTVSLGMFPSTGGPPPHVQIAIDVDGAASGNPFWYDPAGVTLPMGLASTPPGGIFADFLVTTDGPASVALVWEATSVPGAWTLVGAFPLAWSGNIAPGPSIFETAIPWMAFTPAPPGAAFAPGTPAQMTVMSAHGTPVMGAADAPLTASDDVFSEMGAGFTLSPDICPPGPPSTDCEIYFPPPIPAAGVGTADAYITVLYPTADLAIKKGNGTSAVVPGAPVTYTITASNPAGPSTATGATVTDSFPASLTGCTWTCVGISGGLCTPSGGGNINDSVTLPMGGAVTYTATCFLSSNATNSLVNTATITPPLGIIEPNTTNDSATDTDTILALDFGDAPDPTYPTLLASNGARHAIVGPFLGAGADGDTDGQPSLFADGDDLDGNDDEDGVVFTSPIVAGQLSTLTVTTTGGGLLDAWIDFNVDGDWTDPGEQIHIGVPLNPGPNLLSFTPPAAATPGATFARFRYSQFGGLSPSGLALDGEVEDERVTITRQADLAMTITESADPATAGLGLLYTLTTNNNGPSDAGGVIVIDTLPTSTTFLSATPGSPTCTHSSGTVTCNLGASLAAGSSTDVVVALLVNTGTTGTITNTANTGSTDPDPTVGNNSASEVTTIRTPLFADAFETGNLSAWDSHVPEYTLTGGAIGDRTDGISASFRLDAAVLERLRPSPMILMAGLGSNDGPVFLLETKGDSEEPMIRARVVLDDGSRANTGWRAVAPLVGWIELNWRRALTDLEDGFLEVRHDGLLILELTGLDNDHSTLSALVWAELKGQSALQELNHR